MMHTYHISPYEVRPAVFVIVPLRAIPSPVCLVQHPLVLDYPATVLIDLGLVHVMVPELRAHLLFPLLVGVVALVFNE
jgi:hypothetical protein